ncbi:MAG: hypothetical protein OI717_00395 (plasmid) [Candidatus Methanoperedens sp.]|nr:MAG: hypothetical protein OI717_00395 [Candidatus Methanoperedens sp.]
MYARTTKPKNKLTFQSQIEAINHLFKGSMQVARNNLLHIYDFFNDSSMIPDFALCAKIWRVQEKRSSKITKLNGEHHEI